MLGQASVHGHAPFQAEIEGAAHARKTGGSRLCLAHHDTTGKYHSPIGESALPANTAAFGHLSRQPAYTAEIAHRMNIDLTVDDTAARRDLSWAPRGFLTCGDPLTHLVDGGDQRLA